MQNPIEDLNKAYNYSLSFIKKHMNNNHIDPFIITGIVLTMVHSDESYDSINDIMCRDIIFIEYQKIVNNCLNSGSDICFDILSAEYNIDTRNINILELYTEALNILISKDNTVYQSTGFYKIEDKIKQIILELLKSRNIE
jgi:hypothetical protein